MNLDLLPFSDAEEKIIRSYARKKHIVYIPDDPTQDKFLDLGFLERDFSEPPAAHFSPAQRFLRPTVICFRYVDERKRQRKEHRLVTRRFWISTAIPVIALVLSILSIALDIYQQLVR